MTEITEDITAQALFARITSDKDGAARDAALARIHDKTAQVKRVLDAGVPPSEFQVVSKVHAALVASSQAVGKAWTLARKQRDEKGEQP